MTGPRAASPPLAPDQGRVVVPVMSAVGGSGKSVVAAMLATGMAPTGPTVVLDTAALLSSPWASWTADHQADGLAALPVDRPLTRRQVQGAAAVLPGAEASTWHILTDTRNWQSKPLTLPSDPAAWLQLAAAGGWRTVIADTGHRIPEDLRAPRLASRVMATHGWCGLPCAVPVLCAAATADGVHALEHAVMAMRGEGLPLQRTVVVLVANADGRPPAVVRASTTMLRSHVAAVVHLPFDLYIRAHGLRETPKLHARTDQAVTRITDAVLAVISRAWGPQLPPAPQPAAFPSPAPAF